MKLIHNHIKCKNCCNPKCVNCNKLLPQKIHDHKLTCDLCNEKINKEKFNNKWKTSTPQEKLTFYGIEKLKILAKNKQIKNVSKIKKKELINVLIPLVNDNDFPIKLARYLL